MIKGEFEVKTRVQIGDHYKDGALVEIWPVNGVEYLKTERNNDEEDNLGSLPTF